MRIYNVNRERVSLLDMWVFPPLLPNTFSGLLVRRMLGINPGYGVPSGVPGHVTHFSSRCDGRQRERRSHIAARCTLHKAAPAAGKHIFTHTHTHTRSLLKTHTHMQNALTPGQVQTPERAASQQGDYRGLVLKRIQAPRRNKGESTVGCGAVQTPLRAGVGGG